MLALSFLLLIGFTLIVEALHQHIPKGYIYFAMGFSVFVEMLNLRLRKTAEQPVNLHEPYTRGRGCRCRLVCCSIGPAEEDCPEEKPKETKIVLSK